MHVWLRSGRHTFIIISTSDIHHDILNDIPSTDTTISIHPATVLVNLSCAITVFIATHTNMIYSRKQLAPRSMIVVHKPCRLAAQQ